jgi:hypothetical protein
MPLSEPLTACRAGEPAKYEGRPYDLELALGAGQLELRFFDLTVLKRYRLDPRFRFDSNDVGGHLSATDSAVDKGQLLDRDRVFTQFGFAYDSEVNRSVASFAWDLSLLRPEHQQIWKADELQPAGWKPHPGWYASQMGHFPDRVPLFQAFVRELAVVNEMCSAAGWPPLFREDFSKNEAVAVRRVQRPPGGVRIPSSADAGCVQQLRPPA